MNTARNSWFWRGMAVKARVAAQELTHGELRLQMMAIAAAYEAMEKRAQALGKPPPISMRSSLLRVDTDQAA